MTATLLLDCPPTRLCPSGFIASWRRWALRPTMRGFATATESLTNTAFHPESSIPHRLLLAGGSPHQSARRAPYTLPSSSRTSGCSPRVSERTRPDRHLRPRCKIALSSRDSRSLSARSATALTIWRLTG